LRDGSGLDLVKELKAISPKMPALAVSGYGTQEDVEKSLAAGFEIHLTKPLRFAALEKAIADLCFGE